jgi:hypothetical protein
MESRILNFSELAVECFDVALKRNLWNQTDRQVALKLLSELGELADEIRVGRRTAYNWPDAKPLGAASELADLWMILQGWLLRRGGSPLEIDSKPAQSFDTLVNIIVWMVNKPEGQIKPEAITETIVLVVGVAVTLEIDLRAAIQEKLEYNRSQLQLEIASAMPC